MAYRLIGEEYEPLPPADDGGILSAELGLRLVPEGENLALIHFRTGERLLYPPELIRELEANRDKARQAEQRAGRAEQRASQAEQRAGQAEQRAGQAEQRATQADQRVGQAEERAAQLAEELARLQALLPPN